MSNSVIDYDAKAAEFEAAASALRTEAERNGVFNSYDEIGKRVQKLDLNSRRCHRLAAGEVLRPDCQREFDDFMAEFRPLQTTGGFAVHAPVVAPPQPSPLAPSAAAGATLPKVPSEAAEVDAMVARILASDGPAPPDESDPEIAALARTIAASDVEDEEDQIGVLARSIAAA